ncbi:PEPxxWA-CTERM sorting domain-containing protein [Sphingomonas sp. ID1715]|uniref:PEPxxWA-CTERM sorting domain-containing protein n=1 Tax=Sphingomonas sp. ID1715 TaxID=1656898 RepID=UPI001C2CAD0C|nr:PEPxxWA-CTERM sorting domain-containing protein [Sphingomonas sp. ID1715]
MVYRRSALAAAMLIAGTAVPVAAAPFTYFTDFSTGVGPEFTLTNVGVNSNDAGILGQLEGGVVTLAQTTPGAGSGTIRFDLLGFRSIDGANCCTDTFRFSVNDTEVFNGVFALGGGGGEGFNGPPGTTVTGGGPVRTITIPVTLLAGANSFAFTYGTLQGFDDEAWGLDNVGIDAQVAVNGVPEPATWVAMVAGFGLLGGATRRRVARSGIA